MSASSISDADNKSVNARLLISQLLQTNLQQQIQVAVRNDVFCYKNITSSRYFLNLIIILIIFKVYYKIIISISVRKSGVELFLFSRKPKHLEEAQTACFGLRVGCISSSKAFVSPKLDLRKLCVRVLKIKVTRKSQNSDRDVRINEWLLFGNFPWKVKSITFKDRSFFNLVTNLHRGSRIYLTYSENLKFGEYWNQDARYLP